MAIVQISQITVRKGLSTDLPQLAGGEFGWSEDTRQLFIGNGQIPPTGGAPVIGNTEILTEFSVIPVPTVVTLLNNNISPVTAFTLDSRAVTFSYTIIRHDTYRTGTIMIAGTANPLQFNDASIQNADTGIVLSATYLNNQILVKYTSTDTGFGAQLQYLVTISA